MQKKLHWVEPTSLYEVILIVSEYRRRVMDDHTRNIYRMKTQEEIHKYALDNRLWDILNELPEEEVTPRKPTKKR